MSKGKMTMSKPGEISTAKETRRRRILHAMFNGRCYYCGLHVQLGKEPLPRDWLFLKGKTRMMVEDHAHPKTRGGVDGIENRLPACWGCNTAKGWLTVEEYRFVRGLRNRDLSFAFPFEDAKPRDWLCVHSEDEARLLFFHNFPWARDAYSRGAPIRQRLKRAARSRFPG